MATVSTEELTRKKCAPCEGGVPPLSEEQARQMLGSVPGWEMTPDGKSLRRQWTVKHFMAGIEFFNTVAELAEEDGHHPDLHLVGFRNVTIELTTHAIGGLSENDFILAAKINQVPVKEKG